MKDRQQLHWMSFFANDIQLFFKNKTAGLM